MNPATSALDCFLCTIASSQITPSLTSIPSPPPHAATNLGVHCDYGDPKNEGAQITNGSTFYPGCRRTHETCRQPLFEGVIEEPDDGYILTSQFHTVTLIWARHRFAQSKPSMEYYNACLLPPRSSKQITIHSLFARQKLQLNCIHGISSSGYCTCYAGHG